MNSKTYNDIDILLVHDNIYQYSCSIAIKCKKLIRESIKISDIVMLSINEEKELCFIKKSQAHMIGYIRESSMNKDIEFILNKILQKHNKTS